MPSDADALCSEGAGLIGRGTGYKLRVGYVLACGTSFSTVYLLGYARTESAFRGRGSHARNQVPGVLYRYLHNTPPVHKSNYAYADDKQGWSEPAKPALGNKVLPLQRYCTVRSAGLPRLTRRARRRCGVQGYCGGPNSAPKCRLRSPRRAQPAWTWYSPGLLTRVLLGAGARASLMLTALTRGSTAPLLVTE